MGKTSKVVVCGAKKCGKTSILEQAINGNIGPFHSTIEDIYVANVDTDRGTREQLRFIDTEGLEADASALASPPGGAGGGPREIARHWHSIADGFVVVYSVDDERSFQLADAVRRDIERNREKKDVTVLVLGNKSDLPPGCRQVNSVQALNWAARERIKLYEVSSLDRESLYEPLVYLSSRLNPPPSKSTFPQINLGRQKSVKPSGSSDA